MSEKERPSLALRIARRMEALLCAGRVTGKQEQLREMARALVEELEEKEYGFAHDGEDEW